MNTQSTFKSDAQLLAVGEIYSQYDGRRIAQEVARDGGGLPELHRRLGACIGREQGLRAWDRAAGLSYPERDLPKFSFSRMVKNLMSVQAAHAMPFPNQFDRNNEELIDNLKRTRNASCPELEFAAAVPDRARFGFGTPLPWTVLGRDFNVGTAAEAGNLVASGSKLTSSTPDPARNAMVLQRMGVLMPGGFQATFSVPTFTADQTNVGWVAESGAATEGNPTSGLVTFAPKRVASFVEVSKQAVIQGGGFIDAVLTRILYGKALQTMEDAAINGDGTGDNPTGIRSTANITNIVGGTNGAQISWSHVLDLENGPGSNSAPETDLAGYIVNTKTRYWLKKTARGTNLPYMWDGADRPVNGHRVGVTNNLPGTLAKGGSGSVCSSLVYSSDWSLAVVPIFGVPSIMVDPYVKAATGQVRLILSIFMSAGVLMPTAFAKMDDALTA